ncbi:hypothetical protein ACFVWL_06280 [Microbacterium sp. NPDC058269]|uniref:hypothetical protein n=1 Tax=Microbacterium sp. NPDC058269 TaxID=3346414 RepID=UPI0036D7C337
MARRVEDVVPSLSARSVLLSLLFCARPPALSLKAILRAGELVDVSPATMRVAISRAVATGDIDVVDSLYTLAGRHLVRYRNIGEHIRPATKPSRGQWRVVVLTERGRTAAERTATRRALARSRFGELREGVWLRPDNLRDSDLEISTEFESFLTEPADPGALLRRIWDVDEWADVTRAVVEQVRSGPEITFERFRATVAAVRLLTEDLAAPLELLPENWPGADVRAAYEEFRANMAAKMASS